MAQLLAYLDDAGEDPEALLNAQADLFKASFRAQSALADISRSRKRIRSSKPPSWPAPHNDAAAGLLALDEPWHLTPGVDESTDVDAWWLEAEVARRVTRQLRAVGDALAWRVYRYDRRAIVALSRNAEPGLFVGKSGLEAELGHVQSAWQDRQQFALLHDLTSCLRIGDVTEIHRDGMRAVSEIKTSRSATERSATRAQLRRAQEAIEAITGSGPLPGDDNAVLWQASAQYRTHLRDLEPILRYADVRGVAVERVRDRVVGVIALGSAGQDAQGSLRLYRRRMDDLVSRYVGGQGEHAHRALTADTAARHPATAPLGIFPLPVRYRALLICDYLLVDFRMAANSLVSAMTAADINVSLLLEPRSETLAIDAPVYELRRATRSLVIHAAALWQLLIEFVDTQRWADANLELIRRGAPSASPIVTFRNERSAWRSLSGSRG